jgi:opacity protein-like surface antigen
MKKPIARSLIVLLLLAVMLLMLSASSLAAPAEDVFELANWYETGGGGGWMSSQDGSYILGATIGQAEAGEEESTGGGYSLAGGFWSPVDETLLYLPVARKK